MLTAAAVPVTLPAAVVVLKAGHWRLYVDRHRIELSPRPRRNCRGCHDGGWWTGGAFPKMEACGCWSDQRELRIRILPLPAFPDEPPF
ncbi:hypothetical protein [Streptomyces sp. NPDC005407]|uniref:hypothetical protein n=1 Tax=Streptomyces sp. NPDC005407 TaxID=3155340 RepID=UPI0033A5906C